MSTYGIFVIETKNLKGWIFGTPQQQKWTQSIYKTKHHFQNPLHQNYRHTKALESALTLDSKFLIPIIVFVGECTLKTDMPDNVVKGTQALIEYIKSVDQVQILESQLPVLIERIEGIRLNRGHATNRLHLQNLQNEGKHGGSKGNTTGRAPKTIGIVILTIIILLFLTQLMNPPKQKDQTPPTDLQSTNMITAPATPTDPKTEVKRKQVSPLYAIELKSGGR